MTTAKKVLDELISICKEKELWAENKRLETSDFEEKNYYYNQEHTAASIRNKMMVLFPDLE